MPHKLIATLADLKQRVTAPWRSGETPLELRKALLEELVERTVPIAPGKRAVAFDRVRIELYPDNPGDAFVLQEAIETWRPELVQAMHSRLAEIGCRPSVALEIQIVESEHCADAADAAGPPPEASGSGTPSAQPPPEPAGRYALFFERSGAEPVPANTSLADTGPAVGSLKPTAGPPQQPPAAVGSPTPPVASPVKTPSTLDEPEEALAEIGLEIVHGRAEQSHYRFRQPKILIGRSAEILDAHGRLRRRNHVAFEDADDTDSYSGTVSREHARLQYNQDSRDYWLVDERSAFGTRLFRNGRAIDISSRDRRGVRVQLGDEIYLGKAVLRVI